MSACIPRPASSATVRVLLCLAAEVPFRDCDGLICLDVAFDGAEPRTMIFDTGNVSSYVTARRQRRRSGGKAFPMIGCTRGRPDRIYQWFFTLA
jgi:hypothetical protein